MKKNKLLKTLLLLTVMLVGSATNVWADDTLFDYTIKENDSSSSASAEVGTVKLGADKVESSTVATGGYAFKLDGDSGTKYIKGTLANSKTFQAGDIISVSFYCGSNPSGSDYGITICGGTAAFGTNIHTFYSTQKNTVETLTYTVKGTDVTLIGGTDIYFYRASGKSTYFVSATITRPAPAGAVDPEFSLTQSTITIDETSQIQVGSKGNLDGITLTDLAYDATVISIDGTTGLITPVAQGTSTITFKSEAVTDKYNAGEASLSITVTAPQVETPTITASTYFVESQTVEISCETEGASIKYSTDDGATWLDYTSALTFTETTTVKAKAIKNGYLDSEEVSATYTKTTLVELVNVTGAATWDWSKFGTNEIKLTDKTKPSKSEEFVLANVVNYGFCESINEGFGNAQQLKVTCEYPVRDSKYLQGGYIKFYTEVPGTVEVVFSNTGNRTSEDDARFLNINGTNTDASSLKSSETTTGSAKVKAGEVTIKGTLKKDDSDQYLRIYKIVFTPTTADETAPVFTTAPTDEATDVAIDAAVTLTADEDITAVGETITGTIKAGEEDATDIEFTLNGKVLSYAHDPFENNTTYTITLNANQVQDASENKNAETSFSFTTEAAQEQEVGLIVTLPTETRDGYGCTGSTTTANYSTNVYNGETVYLIESGKSITLTVPAYTVVSKIRVSGTSNDNNNSTVTITGANNESASSEFANRKSATATVLDFAPTTQTTTYTISSSNKGSWIIIKVYGEEKDEATVTVSSVGYATFSSSKAFDFSESGITVYTAKANGTSVTLTEVEDGIVPANTGVVLYAAGGASATVSVATTTKTTLEDNEMVANVVLAKVYLEGDNNKTNYILSNEDAGVGFYKAAANGAYLPANRAYLSTTATGTDNAPFLGFDGNETTGINSIERGALNVEGCYTLDGRRVAQPTKGLYIVNGRKVIIK